MAIGGKLGVKDQFLGKFPGPLLPERDKSNGFLILLMLSQSSVRIQEDPFLGIRFVI
jgi:hypothetical protein